jgi:hypothetical protein
MITSNAVIKKGQKDLMPSELPGSLSQVVIIPSGKAIIAGLGESDRPGAI